MHAYLFEAKSLQAYIFATNRLKEIVGASEMIESLTGSLLDEVFKTIGNNIECSRRGGGAFYAFSTDKKAITDLAVLWPLVVRQYAPDLEFIQAQGSGTTAYAAYENAKPLLFAARNAPVARLPQTPPVIIRQRRTGEPAVAYHTKRGEPDEPVDAATKRKLDKKFWRGVDLCKRFAPDAFWHEWPLNLTPELPDDDEDNMEIQGDPRDFPFKKDEQTLALIHADGNGLGQLLITLQNAIKQQHDTYIELFRDFSQAITEATQKAAQLATAEVLQPNRENDIYPYPARPIVLGGDDLTILVRADLALEFTCSFLSHFAIESGTRLQQLKAKYHLAEIPDRLTACAGIVYAKASQPLYLLHELAESLCKHAKKLAKTQDQKNIPTSLSFHRVTTSFVDNYDEVLKRELSFSYLRQTEDVLKPEPSFGCLRQTLECYALEKDMGLAMLDDLLKLRNLLASSDFSKGATRELLGLIGRDQDQAILQYKRWREVMKERSPTQLQHFDKLLLDLGITQANGDLPYSGSTASTIRHSPLGDVLMLMAVGDTCCNMTNPP